MKWWKNKGDTEVKISKLETALDKAEKEAEKSAEWRTGVDEVHAKSEEEILTLKSELKKAQQSVQDKGWKSWEDEKAFWACKAERLEHSKKHPTQNLGVDRR